MTVLPLTLNCHACKVVPMTSWSFEVYDRTYQGWKIVVVEAATRAGAQLLLNQEGYSQIHTYR